MVVSKSTQRWNRVLLVATILPSIVEIMNLQSTTNHFVSSFVVTPSTPTTIAFVSTVGPTTTTTTLFAKKKKNKKSKKGKGGGGQQQQGGFEWAKSFTLTPFEGKAYREIASTACASYDGRTGTPLSPNVKGVADIPKALWKAPVACLVVDAYAGNVEDATDSSDAEANTPTMIVKYANEVALETLGLQPNQFDQLLGTADPDTGDWMPPKQPSPLQLDIPFEIKGDKTYESGYKKKIIKAPTEDITLEKAHRWILEKGAIVDGKFTSQRVGVAYAWESWVLEQKLENSKTATFVCEPGGIQTEQIDVAELEERIATQGAIIRELKEVQGFGNKDPEVMDAVDTLLELKALLEAETA